MVDYNEEGVHTLSIRPLGQHIQILVIEQQQSWLKLPFKLRISPVIPVLMSFKDTFSHESEYFNLIFSTIISCYIIDFSFDDLIFKYLDVSDNTYHLPKEGLWDPLYKVGTISASSYIVLSGFFSQNLVLDPKSVCRSVQFDTLKQQTIYIFFLIRQC